MFAEEDEIQKYKNVNINYDINIKNSSIVERKAPFGGMQVLQVEYVMAINYLSPNIGHIRFEGSADYRPPDGFKLTLQEIKEKWDSGAAPPEVQNEVANSIMHNIAPVAMILSQRLGLPPAVPLPNINFQAKNDAGKTEFKSYYHG